MKNSNENQTGAEAPLFPANVPRQVSLAGADAGTEKSGSEGATPAVLEAGSVPERQTENRLHSKVKRASD
jgi:hypothetical protein